MKKNVIILFSSFIIISSRIDLVSFFLFICLVFVISLKHIFFFIIKSLQISFEMGLVIFYCFLSFCNMKKSKWS